MSTVDEILATGRYVDRRGRKWKIVRSPRIGIWWGTPHTDDLMLVLHENKMRLLIEREQHRDECPGLWTCEDHPVPAVTLSRMFRPRVYVNGEPYAWFSEAIDAARALAVGE